MNFIILLLLLVVILYLNKKFSKKENNYNKEMIDKKENDSVKEISDEERYQNYANYYKCKDRIWDNDVEKNAYNNIVKILRNSSGTILFKWYQLEAIPHLSLREIFISKNKKYEKMNLDKLSNYHVDIAFIDSSSGKVIFAIEIDGNTHKQKQQLLNDIFKDNVFKFNDIPLIRIENEKINDKNYIINKIEENTVNLAPICPLCYKKMVVRTNKRTGENFWGCSSFPCCKGSR